MPFFLINFKKKINTKIVTFLKLLPFSCKFLFVPWKWIKKNNVAKKSILLFTHFVRLKVLCVAYQQQKHQSCSIRWFFWKKFLACSSLLIPQWIDIVVMNFNGMSMSYFIFHICSQNRTTQFEWNNFVNKHIFFNFIEFSVCDVRRLTHMDEWLVHDLGKCVCIVDLYGYRYRLRIDMRKLLFFFQFSKNSFNIRLKWYPPKIVRYIHSENICSTLWNCSKDALVESIFRRC